MRIRIAIFLVVVLLLNGCNRILLQNEDIPIEDSPTTIDKASESPSGTTNEPPEQSAEHEESYKVYDSEYPFVYEVYKGTVRILECDTSVTELVVPEYIEDLPVRTIFVCSFEYCVDLEKIELPSTITHILDGAFAECYSIKEIDMPDSVIELGAYVFADCKALETVNFSKNLDLIRERTFWNNPALKSVTFPPSVIFIESNAFLMCPELETVIFESTDGVLIGKTSFSTEECPKLKEIIIGGITYTPDENGSFEYLGNWVR